MGEIADMWEDYAFQEQSTYLNFTNPLYLKIEKDLEEQNFLKTFDNM